MPDLDFVLITIDSFRADHVGYLNDEGSLTPNIDEFAADATLATAATSPSSHTRASMPAVLTSQYAHNFFSDFLGDTDIPTIAQYLSGAGYETAAFHSNPLLSRHFGYDRGFDTFHDGLRFVESTQLPEFATRLYSKVSRLVQRYPYEPAEAITPKALKWLSRTNSPAFLWVHYMDPHGPYALNRDRGYVDKFQSERLWRKAVTRPDEVTTGERKRLHNAYREEIRHTDRHVGLLLDELTNRDSVQTVLTGDHGEEFYEHGTYSHHAKLYEEVTRVPLVVDVPSRDTMTKNTTPYSLLDIVPTVLECTDVQVERSLTGADLLSLTEGEIERGHVITETNPEDELSVGVRTDRWKYIATGDRRELYDLHADPSEQTDRSNNERGVREEFEEILVDHIDEHDVSGGDKLATVADDMDTEMRDRLSDLGYL